MRRIISITALFFTTLLLTGQGAVGSWDDQLSYSSSFCVTAGGDRIYSSAGASVLVYDRPSGETSSFSRISGLNETAINLLAWCDDEDALIIVYKNTGIDIVRKGVITNIPDIKNKYIAGLKEIYGITVSGTRAWLSGSFGIVVVDIRGKYIADTWKPGPDGETNPVNGTVILDNNVYAATDNGIYYAPLSRPGLSYYGNWELLDELPSPESKYNALAAAGSALFVNKPGISSASDSLFRVIPGQEAVLIATEPRESIRSLDTYGSEIVMSLPSSIRLLNNNGSFVREITGYGWASANPVCATGYQGILWIADASVGLVSTSDYSNFSNYTLAGPYTNNVADIEFAGNRFYITGGTVDNSWGNVYRPFQVFTGTGNTWKSHLYYDVPDRDAMRITEDPADENHFFVSSWGNGLYEFSEGELVKVYNQYNSPLSSIIPGENYTRICGLAYDRSGNLWMTHSGVAGNLKLLTPGGNWVSTSLNLNVPVVGDLIIDRNQYIWVILPRGNGLLVYDPAGTPEVTSDDRYLRLQVQDAEGHVMNNIFSLSADLDGNIWVGTDMGPAVFYNPGKVFSGDLKASRIKIPRNDGSGLADYLLGTETVTTIAIDGANRKWFGTISSGAYLMSDDGKEELIHFTSSNSPLLSDNLVKIAVNGVTGEIWFGTSEGIVSFRGDATEGNTDYSGVYAFPNPVREDFDGVVTITGLVENSSVKITDISGNLVYETTSLGGQVTWDLRNYRSQRIATGVYLVFCTNDDRTLARVIKMLVIR